MQMRIWLSKFWRTAIQEQLCQTVSGALRKSPCSGFNPAPSRFSLLYFSLVINGNNKENHPAYPFSFVFSLLNNNIKCLQSRSRLGNNVSKGKEEVKCGVYGGVKYLKL